MIISNPKDSEAVYSECIPDPSTGDNNRYKPLRQQLLIMTQLGHHVATQVANRGNPPGQRSLL